MAETYCVPKIWKAAGLFPRVINSDAGGNNTLPKITNLMSLKEPNVLGNVVVDINHPCKTDGWVELRPMK